METRLTRTDKRLTATSQTYVMTDTVQFYLSCAASTSQEGTEVYCLQFLSVGTPITKVNFNTHDIGSICFSVFLYEVICILKTYCPLICMHNTNYVIIIVHLVTNYIIRIVHLVLCLKRINIKSVNVCTGNGNSINQRSSSFPKV